MGINPVMLVLVLANLLLVSVVDFGQGDGISVEFEYKDNGCLSFDGINDFVFVSDVPKLRVGTEMTVELWFRTDYVVDGRVLISRWGGFGNQGAFSLAWMMFDAFGFHTKNATGDYLTCNTRYAGNDGDWHHVAASWNGRVAIVYFDGQEAGRAVAQEGFTKMWNGVPADGTPAVPVIIGGDNSTFVDRYFHGDIDEVRIWSVARSGPEIRQTMHATLYGQETGLLLNYRFDEGHGNMAYDLHHRSSHLPAHGILGGLAGEDSMPTWKKGGAPLLLGGMNQNEMPKFVQDL